MLVAHTKVERQGWQQAEVVLHECGEDTSRCWFHWCSDRRSRWWAAPSPTQPGPGQTCRAGCAERARSASRVPPKVYDPAEFPSATDHVFSSRPSAPTSEVVPAHNMAQHREYLEAIERLILPLAVAVAHKLRHRRSLGMLDSVTPTSASRREAQRGQRNALGQRPRRNIACPVQPVVPYRAVAEDVRVVRRGAPVGLDQIAARRDVAKYIAGCMEPVIVAEGVEELVLAADVDVDAAEFAVEPVRAVARVVVVVLRRPPCLRYWVPDSSSAASTPPRSGRTAELHSPCPGRRSACA